MKRVSKEFIFISDSNNFGQVKPLLRLVKQILNSLKLWKFLVYVRTRGKRYTFSEGDEIAYSFSIFDLLKHLKDYSLFLHSTVDSAGDIYKNASHLALFAAKKRSA